MALGWAVALERALAGSTPYPDQGYGRNLDACIFVVVDWRSNLNRNVSLALIDLDSGVFVFDQLIPRGFASFHMIPL